VLEDRTPPGMRGKPHQEETGMWKALEKRAAAFAAVLLAMTAPALGQEAPIMIGVQEPLSGVNAYYGQQARMGAALAIAEANAAGGVNGRKLAADYLDNQCNPAEGVKALNQMLSTGKYIAILDGGCSSVALAIMPLIEKAGIPYVIGNPSAPAISERSGIGGNKWTFKVNPTDATMLASLVTWLVQNKGADKVSVLAEDTDYGRGGAKALGDLLGKSSKAMLPAEFFPKGATDFSGVFARIKASRPSQLALFAIGADTVNVLNQWYESGGGVPLTGRIQLEQIPKPIIGSPVFAGLSTVQPWDMAVDNAENRRFIAEFQKLANQLPTVNAWGTYEATRTLIAAIAKAGRNPTPAAVRDALQGIKVPAMFGGYVEFDQNHLAHVNAIVLTLKDGKVVVLGLSKT
jgi:branched-chain amino acid transport system substrate-binding protein